MCSATAVRLHAPGIPAPPPRAMVLMSTALMRKARSRLNVGDSRPRSGYHICFWVPADSQVMFALQRWLALDFAATGQNR
jgi:hypothetical protein